jgi:hypothetical protein
MNGDGLRFIRAYGPGFSIIAGDFVSFSMFRRPLKVANRVLSDAVSAAYRSGLREGAFLAREGCGLTRMARDGIEWWADAHHAACGYAGEKDLDSLRSSRGALPTRVGGWRWCAATLVGRLAP